MIKSERKLLYIIAGIFCAFMLCKMPVLAKEPGEAMTEDSMIQEYVELWTDSLELNHIDAKMKELFPEFEINTGETFRLIVEGRVTEALRKLGDGITGYIRGELMNIRQVFLTVLILGVVSALFSGFSDLFAGQQISQAGFYFLYLFLMVLTTGIFSSVSEIALGAVENIVLFIKMFIPTYFVVVGTAQGPTTAMFYYELMLIVAYLVESFLSTVLIPLICSYVLLALLNGIWVEEKLSLLLDFIRKGIVMALKLSLGAVTGLSLVQAVIVPVLDRLKISAVRKAVSAIPGIGGIAEGVTELVLGAAVLIKNSMGVLLLVLLLGICLAPVVQILIITMTMKLGAAVTGIVSDKRISGCVDRVGEGCFLLLRCVLTAVALFLIVIAVVAYAVSS
ncbi:MAG: stage III sporulation protein AE [Bacillota bacterium]|nr:stage III sporulation protein AE [Bacillota bacterium]